MSSRCVFNAATGQRGVAGRFQSSAKRNRVPSPFPGMDPYLESPDIWPDLHDALAGEIRGVLNRTLPSPYYARLEMRPEVGIDLQFAFDRVYDAGPYSRGAVDYTRPPNPPLPAELAGWGDECLARGSRPGEP